LDDSHTVGLSDTSRGVKFAGFKGTSLGDFMLSLFFKSVSIKQAFAFCKPLILVQLEVMLSSASSVPAVPIAKDAKSDCSILTGKGTRNKIPSVLNCKKNEFSEKSSVDTDLSLKKNEKGMVIAKNNHAFVHTLRALGPPEKHT
jgi:hypothetical protein